MGSFAESVEPDSISGIRWVSVKVAFKDGKEDVLSIFGVLLKSECSVGEFLLTCEATRRRYAAAIIDSAFMDRLISLTLGMVEE